MDDVERPVPRKDIYKIRQNIEACISEIKSSKSRRIWDLQEFMSVMSSILMKGISGSMDDRVTNMAWGIDGSLRAHINAKTDLLRNEFSVFLNNELNKIDLLPEEGLKLVETKLKKE